MIAEAALLAALAAVAVGTVGALVVRALAARSLVAAAVVAPVVVILSVALGVVVTARAMFINEHDQAVVLVVTATSLPIAAVFGWLIARRVQEAMRASAEEAAERDRDRQVEESRRELVAWVSHDLRTPLAGIRAMAEALEDGHAPADGSYPARIRSEADRMSDMVGGLLALSRLQSGTLRLDRAPVDLGDLVSDALASARVLADRRGVHVAGSAPADSVTASADAGEPLAGPRQPRDERPDPHRRRRQRRHLARGRPRRGSHRRRGRLWRHTSGRARPALRAGLARHERPDAGRRSRRRPRPRRRARHRQGARRRRDRDQRPPRLPVRA